MAILVWVYYSASIFFFLRAEFTYVYTHQLGVLIARNHVKSSVL
jgi:uncharacterized BrkB/YihY/UPF0761 family membrane protein